VPVTEHGDAWWSFVLSVPTQFRRCFPRCVRVCSQKGRYFDPVEFIALLNNRFWWGAISSNALQHDQELVTNERKHISVQFGAVRGSQPQAATQSIYLHCDLLNSVLLFGLLYSPVSNDSRSQWPLGLRHEPSSPAQTLGSWVRNPLEAWMSVCVYSVVVLSCV
jgi:hypothetical protein